MSKRFRTIALYKPYGVLCQFRDSSGRPTLASLVPIPGIYPAGRLDFDSEGLLLLTEDGETGPPPHRPAVRAPQDVSGPGRARAMTARRSKRCGHGVELRDGRTRPAQSNCWRPSPPCPTGRFRFAFARMCPTAWLQLSITEGRNRQVRRMTAAVGHPTLRLVRVAVGPVSLGDLAPGQWRELSAQERAALDDMKPQVASRLIIN